jgi:hypothetical protein
VGSKIAASVFNQGIEDQRLLVCDSPAAKAVKSTLELCKPSLTHLFGDNDTRIDKALEAAKFSRYQAAPYRSLPLQGAFLFLLRARQKEETL